MWKYRNPHHMYTTGSVKGVSNTDSEFYKSTMYYYIRVVVNGKTYYLDKEYSLTDQKHATSFAQKTARKIVSEMKSQYNHIQIFSTTKNYLLYKLFDLRY